MFWVLLLVDCELWCFVICYCTCCFDALVCLNGGFVDFCGCEMQVLWCDLVFGVWVFSLLGCVGISILMSFCILGVLMLWFS